MLSPVFLWWFGMVCALWVSLCPRCVAEGGSAPGPPASWGLCSGLWPSPDWLLLQFVLAALVLSLLLPKTSQYIKWIVAAGLAQVSEFSLVLGSRARRARVISREVSLHPTPATVRVDTPPGLPSALWTGRWATLPPTLRVQGFCPQFTLQDHSSSHSRCSSKSSQAPLLLPKELNP